VEHRASKMYRALKIISKRFLPKDKLKRIYYEIELLKNLDHPNIIKIYEFFEDSEKICFILELC
jgi:calcium-dependent protein kinase